MFNPYQFYNRYISCPYCGDFLSSKDMYFHLLQGHHLTKTKTCELIDSLIWKKYHE